ncbi:uncharacterized protein LOC142324831 [Lycorma delicatula]|uniref:uncharacterized protein LOC142324831 n=1 Tax=Lycorma delicatula TaxID=130591 RepID=UPI003F516259
MERPREGSKCKIKLKMQNNDTPFFPTEYLKDDFSGSITVGEADREFDRAVDKCVTLMDTKEKSKLTVKLENNQYTVTVYVTLIEFTPSPPSYEWSKEKKLEVARHHKEKGCELFKQGRVQDSFLRFSKAVKFLITLGIENKDVEPLYFTLCNNMAWCQLSRGQASHALTLCNKVLSNNPNNVKALMRRAEAFVWLQDTEHAVMDLRKVKELEPRNNIARERLIKLENKLAIETVRYNNIIKSMFRF